jgi:hypothetical protein
MNDFIIFYCFENTGDNRSTGERELYSTVEIICQSKITEVLACHNPFEGFSGYPLPHELESVSEFG